MLPSSYTEMEQQLVEWDSTNWYGVTFTKRHRYGDWEIQPAEGNMKKAANIEILVYGKKYYTNGARTV